MLVGAVQGACNDVVPRGSLEETLVVVLVAHQLCGSVGHLPLLDLFGTDIPQGVTLTDCTAQVVRGWVGQEVGD